PYISDFALWLGEKVVVALKDTAIDAAGLGMALIGVLVPAFKIITAAVLRRIDGFLLYMSNRANLGDAAMALVTGDIGAIPGIIKNTYDEIKQGGADLQQGFKDVGAAAVEGWGQAGAAMQGFASAFDLNVLGLFRDNRSVIE